MVRAEPSPPSDLGPLVDYVVQGGDTLSAIAARCHTTPDSIARLNGIGVRTPIHPGQPLTVPEACVAPEVVLAPPVPAARPAPVGPVASSVPERSSVPGQVALGLLLTTIALLAVALTLVVVQRRRWSAGRLRLRSWQRLNALEHETAWWPAQPAPEPADRVAWDHPNHLAAQPAPEQAGPWTGDPVSWPGARALAEPAPGPQPAALDAGRGPRPHPLAGELWPARAVVHAELTPRGVVALANGLWPAVWRGPAGGAPRRSEAVWVRLDDTTSVVLLATDGQPMEREGGMR
jgi:LysM repeat protein